MTTSPLLLYTNKARQLKCNRALFGIFGFVRYTTTPRCIAREAPCAELRALGLS